MKRRKWQKAVALLAGVMMVCTLPGVENLVETSHFVRAESSPEGAFSDGEMQAQEARVLSQYSEADVWSSGEDGDLFSSGGENNSSVQMVPDTAENAEKTTSEPMQVNVTLTGEIQDKKAQGEAQWIQIHAEDASLASEGESRVRIHLYDNADRSPADDLEVLLFTEKQEKIPETAVLPPVVLERALNGAEELTVSRKQIYQQDENGTILLDENGEQIVTDDYLEFTLPAGKTADFYAALLYRNVEEIYSYDALLNTEVLQKVNGAWRSVLNWNEAAETTVGWTNPETAAAENAPEEQAAEPEISDEEGQETEDSASQIFADGEESESGQEGGNAAEETADEEISEDEKPAEETGNSEEPDSSEEMAGSEEKASLEEESSLEEPGASEEEGSIEEIDGSKEEDDSEKSGTDEEENPTDDEEDQETEDIETDNTETEDTEADISKADMSEQEENTSRILVTMTKELGEGPEEMMTNEPEASEETKEEDAEVFQESDTDTTERIEETAVSGQTYAVHVQAQDLQPEAKYDSVVTIHLTDLATGLPATDVATAVCLSKEAALASEAAFETELPEAVQTPAGVQNLKVTRMQETADTETGESTVTDDYLQFTLPAGSSADFYLGLTYTTEEADYNKQLILDVKAVQYVPIEETAEPSVSDDADTAADPNPNQNTADDTSQSELLADESSAPTDAAQELLSAPVNVASTELVGLTSFSNAEAQDTEVFMQAAADEIGDASSDGSSDDNLKAVDVAVGTTAMTLLWASATRSNEKRIYLNPSGMTQNGIDWSGDTTIYLGVETWGDLLAGTKDTQTGYWYWDGTNWDNTEHRFYFTYTNDWNKIKTYDYYRTQQTEFTLGTVWGKVFVQDGTDPQLIDSRKVYKIKEFTSYGGQELYFMNMDSSFTPNSLQAEFSGEEQTTPVSMTVTDFPGLYKVTIPYDVDYDTVAFKDGEISLATEKVINGEYNPDISNTYYYNATEKQDGTKVGGWSKKPEGSASLTGKKLYFDKLFFQMSDGCSIQIGNGTPKTISADANDGKTFSYQLTAEDNADQRTIITFITKEGTKYHFLWKNLTKDAATISSEIVNVTGTYVKALTVYFDAALSKLDYTSSGVGDYGIPNKSGTIRYYATGDGKADAEGDMVLVPAYSNGTNTWRDVYKADLPEGYTKIAFSSFDMSSATNYGAHGESTTQLTIPTDLMNPCFYADTSDKVIYDGGQRDGYWGEVYTTRDAEANKSGVDIVDITKSNFSRSGEKLYVNSTFYDYYTDYELNGNNRDNYKVTNGASQRNWVNFRQFDQALSDYYKANNVSIPLYTGQFQPDQLGGTTFSTIASTLNLYGYDYYNKFFSTNNSALDINGNNDGNYAEVAKGLVNNSLSSNGLPTVKNGDVQLPYFDENFLEGNNSKNSVLGEVYHNVAFPFEKKDIENNGVDYWCYDSAEKSLAMRQDSGAGAYYLEEFNPQGWSQNVDSSSKAKTGENSHGLFPFNETSTTTHANTYNYGYGAKLDISFRLTEDGTVLDNKGNPVDITFEFSGDDDVWVFIDGELALDMGGDHARATGSLNFNTKKATVSSVKASAGDAHPENKTDFSIKGKNTDEHTLTMFYMERGMWESNMKITFNFPDESLLEVQKEVDVSDVNQDLFKGIFDNFSLFEFEIKNLATHYGSKDVVISGEEAKPAGVNLEMLTEANLSSGSAGNTFELVTKDGEKVIHWYAKERDTGGSWRDKRYGKLNLNTPIDISNMQYLEFKLYYDYNDTPTLSNMYLQLLDESGKVKGNNTSYLSGKTYGSVSMAGKQWVTVKIDLSKLSEDNGFSNRVSEIRFGYNYDRDFYLKDFVFYPKAGEVTLAGFTVQQEDIPDYGSATSGQLEYPKGAAYTSSASESNYRIGSDGIFVLQNHEKITFHDCFRRGSYIALKEIGGMAFAQLFDTSWTMYENDEPVTNAAASQYCNGSSSEGYIGVKSMAVEDGRTEKTMEGQQSGNNYSGTKPSDNTFVFRSYYSPDSASVQTKLKVVYTNKVNVGSLTIKKEKADGSEDLNQKYHFEVTFTDVGDMGLENDSIKTDIYLGVGEEQTITGIPLGTHFKIQEMDAGDGSVIDNIVANPNHAAIYTTEGYMQGQLTTTDTNMTVTFTNVKKPVVNVGLQKKWQDESGADLTQMPNKIRVQLQRKLKNAEDATYQAVEVNGSEIIDIEPGYTAWSEFRYSISGLDKYDNFTDSTGRKEYVYRFVEVNDEDEVIAEGERYSIYQVSYTQADTPENTENNEPAVFATTITNKTTKTDLEITKVNPDKQPLQRAQFDLYKEDSSSESEIPGTQQVTGTKVTDSPQTTDENGIAKFASLEDGTYYLVEVQAPTGYKIGLESAVKIEIAQTSILSVKINDTAAGETEATSGNITYSLSGNKLSLKVKNELVTTNLKILKVKKDTTDPLSGAEFKLYKPDKAGSEVEGLPKGGKFSQVNTEDNLTTGSDGILQIADLSNGTYYLMETEAPIGYKILTNPIKIEIDRTSETAPVKITVGDKETVVTSSDEETENAVYSLVGDILTIKVENELLKTNLKLVKQDAENQKKLAGVVFNLYKPYTEPDASTGTPSLENLTSGLGDEADRKLYGLVKTDGSIATVEGEDTKLTTDSSGELVVNGLENGTYYLAEAAVNDGYKLLDSVIKIHIDRTKTEENGRFTAEGTGVNSISIYSDDTITVTIDNVPLTKVQITKADSTDSGIKLSGAEFALYKESVDGSVTTLPTGETGTFAQIGVTLTTGSDGIAATDFLEPGTYYLVETKAPERTDDGGNAIKYNKLTSAIQFTVAYEQNTTTQKMESSVKIVSGSGVTLGTLTETSDGSHIFAVTISDPPYTSLKIKKTGKDASDQDVTDMSGVKFDFYRQYTSHAAALADGVAEEYILEVGNGALEGTNLPSAPAGVVYVKLKTDLTTEGAENIAEITGTHSDGTYYLVETEAKEGFQKLENPIRITISHATDENLTPSVTAEGATVEKGNDGIYQITVANVMLSRTNLRIQKVNMKKPPEPLGGVVFELYQRLSSDTDDKDAKTAQELAAQGINGLAEDYKYKKITAVDTDGNEIVWETSSAEDENKGYTPYIKDLEDGIYCIVETKTAAGYSLLKSPIVVTLNRRAGTGTIEGVDTPFTIDGNGNLTITVTNQGTFVIPATGSWSRYIMMFGGAILAGLATIMYLLQKRRKGGTTS